MRPVVAEPPRGAEFRAVVVLTWAAIVLPNLVQTLTAPKARKFTYDVVQLSRLADLTSLACNLALVGMCVVVIVRRLDRLPSDRRTVLLILLLPWIYQVTRDLYADISIKQGAVVYPLLVLVAWVLRPRLRELSTLGYLIGLTAVMSLLLGAVLPEKGVLVSSAGGLVTPDKEILPWGSWSGPSPTATRLASSWPSASSRPPSSRAGRSGSP